VPRCPGTVVRPRSMEYARARTKCRNPQGFSGSLKGVPCDE
jgi:hypothetical protein